MTNAQFEKIYPVSLNSPEKSLQALLEKAYSPYKPTLKNQVREDTTLKYLYNYNKRLYNLALKNPQLSYLLKTHPWILSSLRENEKLLFTIINNPRLFNELLENPEKLLKKFLGYSLETKEKVLPSKTSKPKISTEETIERLTNLNQIKEEVLIKKLRGKPTKPHRLEPEIIAKAHIENPNTRISLGEFKQPTKNDFKNLEFIRKIQPQQPVNGNKLIFNPLLTGILSAISATVNFLKIKSTEEKRFETLTTSEIENLHEETIKGVTEVNASEPAKKA